VVYKRKGLREILKVSENYKEEIMKKAGKWLALLTVIALILVSLTACGGAAGPAGPQGPPGEEGATGPAGPAGAPGAAAVIGTGTITSTNIADLTIATIDIAPNAVTDAKVVDALTITGGTIDGTIIGGTTRAAASFTSLTVGAGATGTAITRHLSASASLNFDFSGAGITVQDLTIAVANSALGDTVAVGIPNAAAAVDNIFIAWVSAAGTVTVRGFDVASGGNDPAAATFRVDVWQH